MVLDVLYPRILVGVFNQLQYPRMYLVVIVGENVALTHIYRPK
jgi:hypothetical protein